ncbi:50S ribosomal protein L9 [Candidatus Parcubacteria bacterium]|nr:MAG: 50S ribosomal protein L9 [Candidatus Parcubacteria bacterium]
MKVILLAALPGVGEKFTVKDVKGGYARNYLFPRKLAIPATPEALRDLERRREAWRKREEKITKHLQDIARALEGKEFVFPVRVNAAGKVFGSVTKEMILRAVRDTHLFTKERVDINISHPLKEVGTHELEVVFKKGITARVRVVLQPQP